MMACYYFIIARITTIISIFTIITSITIVITLGFRVVNAGAGMLSIISLSYFMTVMRHGLFSLLAVIFWVSSELLIVATLLS